MSSGVAEGNSALVTAFSLNAAKYTSYTALMSVTNAGRTTKAMLNDPGLETQASSIGQVSQGWNRFPYALTLGLLGPRIASDVRRAWV
jgi:hypothetical protein